MTWIFPNGTGNAGSQGDLCATWAVAVYKLKEQLKTAGWVVKASSDGTTYNSSADQISSGSSGANGMDNAKAWFRIQSPDLAHEFTFQRQTTTGASTSGSWRIKYSKSAKFTGGSPAATVTPSATDEQVLLGAGTDASPTFAAWNNSATDNTLRIQIGADNATGYSWYCFATTNGAGTVASAACMAFDSLVGGPTADPDPYVIWLPGGSTNVLLTYGASTGAGMIDTNIVLKGYTNTTFGVMQTALPMTYRADNAVYQPLVTALGADLVTGKDDTFPVCYARNTPLTTLGWKGVSTIFKLGFVTRTNLNTATISSTRDYVYVSNCLLPWDGSLPIA